MADIIAANIDCARCGSDDLVWPHEDGDGSMVTCNACRAEVGTYGTLRAAALRKRERAATCSRQKGFRGGL
jgi:hypothetical protein